MIAWIDDTTAPFPPVHKALQYPNGLLAAGGDLSPDRLINAYRQGIFPWFNEDDPILWWSPDPRCILLPEHCIISKSLRKKILKMEFKLTLDQAFESVVRACAAPRKQQQETWISEQMIFAYHRLFKMGVAHSVEVWKDEQLVGGLYGLSIGSLFFGESMFSRANDASKIAFVYLCKQLKHWNFTFIDCQVPSEHLHSLGAQLISRQKFLSLLRKHIDDPQPHPWTFSIAENDFRKTS